MPTDYFDMAADLARGLDKSRMGNSKEFAESHWNLWDEFVDRHGQTKAACGRTVPKELITPEPTCEVCAAHCKAFQELKFG